MLKLMKAGLGVFTGGTSLWIPYLIIAVVAGGISAWGTWWVKDQQVTAARALQTKAESQLDLVTNDRDNQVVGIAARDKIIADQQAEMNRIAADAALSQAAALSRAEEAERQAAETEAVNAKLRRIANAANREDQPKSLSPYARLSADWLRCRQQAGPEASPGACADKVRLPAD